MDRLIGRIQAILNRIPGPGKLLFGSLTADRASFRALAACMLAVLGTFLAPPVISLGSPPIEQGLRDMGSGVPILVAANYLLLAILTLVAGALGDTLGRKRFLLIGLACVLAGELASMFWLATGGFIYANILLNIAQITITPMCIALVAVIFAPGVRPFAYGAIFSIQGIAMGSSSALYSVLKPLGNGTIVFFLPIVLGVIAFVLVLRQVHELKNEEAVSWRELLVNMLWAGAVFIAVYGLVAYAGGFTSRNALLTIAIGMGGLILAYRYFYRRLRNRGEIKLYNVRGLAFAILAAMTTAMVQAVLFFQFWTYFVDVRGLGAVAATLQFAPFIIGMLVGTTLIVRLSTRFGARRLITGGLILMAVGLFFLSRITVDIPLAYLVLPITLLGLGLGFTGPARTSVILSAPPPRLIGSGAAINSAAGQSGYALGVIVSSLLITTLADNALHAQLHQSNLPSAVIAQIDSAWENAFTRAMSNDYTKVPAQLTQWVTTHFAPAFTTGLADTLLVTAAFVVAVAVFIFVGMERGLKGSLMTPPKPAAGTPQDATDQAQDNEGNETPNTN